jgi:uncharacterized protein
MQTLAGIDYGSKLAGTTAIALLHHDELKIFCSKKHEDADAFIINTLGLYKDAVIGIDAPLSLPTVYSNTKSGDDYFYREADKQLKAMSPMFLGGLTARAMKLKSSLRTTMYEVYPAVLVKHLGLKDANYKKEKEHIGYFTSILLQQYNLHTTHTFTSWHEADALLALISTIRITQQQAIAYGNKEEGLIWV